MSEQTPSNSSEDLAKSVERQDVEGAAPNFLEYTDLILDQADEAEEQETRDGIQAIIASIEVSARDGLITSSQGEAQGVDYIHNALDMYVDWANTSPDKRTPKSPLVFLTRKGGVRSSLSELAYDDRTEGLLLEVLTQNRADRIEAKAESIPVPTGDNLASLMGASEARSLVDAEAPAVASELEPEERDEIEEDLAEEAFDQMGIAEPETKAPALRFDLEAAKARVEAEKAERAISHEDLNDLQQNVNDLLYQFEVTGRYSGAEAAMAREQLGSSTLVNRLASKSRQEREGIRSHSKQTLAYELGAYLTMASNPNVINELIDEARQGELLDEADLAQIEAAIGSISRGAAGQGDGQQFHEVIRVLQSNTEHRTDEQKLSPVDFALRGAIIGAYTQLGEPDALHYASRIHNGNMTDFSRIKK